MFARRIEALVLATGMLLLGISGTSGCRNFAGYAAGRDSAVDSGADAAVPDDVGRDDAPGVDGPSTDGPGDGPRDLPGEELPLDSQPSDLAADAPRDSSEDGPQPDLQEDQGSDLPAPDSGVDVAPLPDLQQQPDTTPDLPSYTGPTWGCPAVYGALGNQRHVDTVFGQSMLALIGTTESSWLTHNVLGNDDGFAYVVDAPPATVPANITVPRLLTVGGNNLPISPEEIVSAVFDGAGKLLVLASLHNTKGTVKAGGMSDTVWGNSHPAAVLIALDLGSGQVTWFRSYRSANGVVPYGVALDHDGGALVALGVGGAALDHMSSGASGSFPIATASRRSIVLIRTDGLGAPDRSLGVQHLVGGALPSARLVSRSLTNGGSEAYLVVEASGKVQQVWNSNGSQGSVQPANQPGGESLVVLRIEAKAGSIALMSRRFLGGTATTFVEARDLALSTNDLYIVGHVGGKLQDYGGSQSLTVNNTTYNGFIWVADNQTLAGTNNTLLESSGASRIDSIALVDTPARIAVTGETFTNIATLGGETVPQNSVFVATLDSGLSGRWAESLAAPPTPANQPSFSQLRVNSTKFNGKNYLHLTGALTSKQLTPIQVGPQGGATTLVPTHTDRDLFRVCITPP